MIYTVVESGKKWRKVERRISFRRSAYKGKVEQMFLGQFEHTIDEKGRMTIPARFRELLGEGGYVTLGLDQNLVVMTAETFKKRAEKALEPGLTNENARIFRRVYFSSAAELQFDKNGRILIPQFLRSSAHLENAAVVTGVGADFEIWSPQLWADQIAKMQDPVFLAEHTNMLNI